MRPLAALLALGLTFGAPLAFHAQATVALPPVNLGDSSFQDGMAGPGRLFQQTLSGYHAERFRDDRGRPTAAPPQVRSVALLGQLSVLSERRLFGAWWGGEVIVPLVHARVTPAGGDTLHASGFGDVFVSPLILQWPQTRLAGRPFWQRLNLNLTLPTGRHGQRGRLDLGRNVRQFNPHYAFTWEASDVWELSGRLHYLWTSANHDPAAGLEAVSVQAGEALHLNASVSRQLAPDLRVGASMYALVQITDDRIDGVAEPGRERIVGVGPALAWSQGASSVYASVYLETLARDRAEGVRLSLRYATRF